MITINSTSLSSPREREEEAEFGSKRGNDSVKGWVWGKGREMMKLSFKGGQMLLVQTFL